ncbi:MAG: hypothetical protein HLUCCX10_00130 [Algoriphagus marincola HL-49]|uniref:DUF4221 domain-containing protein n=1 Tax=Algoriphagus marincola HL-49 TaxID=1305737 RepID=A0A0P7YFS6_9BACT|nr:MAG: hypothetical protein HLUCCX10_00130 [Algoriphagus marincola HL-49]
MKNQIIIYLSIAILFMISCKNDQTENSVFEKIELEWIDSISVAENNDFFNGASDAQLIGDSLLAVSSFLTPGVWFLDASNGEIKYRVSDCDIVDIPLYPAGFLIQDFPELHILDPKQKSIFVFHVIDQTLVRKFLLSIPENKMIRTVDSFFWKNEDFFMVELFPSLLNHNKVGFYKEVDELIGIFDHNGTLVNRFLFYPKKLKKLDYPITPYQTFTQTKSNLNSLKISFPSDRFILEYNSINTGKINEILEIPSQSDFFEFNPAGLEKEFNPEFQKYWQVPNPHFFKNMVENEKFLIIQTIMRNNNNLKNYEAKSHLFVYDKNKKKWFESSNPTNINRMGYLAGIINEELIFFEGSQRISEEKYIKRAVLRPVVD